jgi:putative acetyltransferase
LILDTDPDAGLVRELFQEYAREIGIEIDEEPSRYELILVAMDAAIAAGCAAMRPLSPEIAEIKRLFVRDPYRGTGLGRLLARSVIDRARRRGYTAIRLDTLPTMQPAIAMYRSLGFTEIPAYHDDRLPGMIFFELNLTLSSER